ncbi:MAG TPA: glucokinase [Thermoanaerobaculia bacterium]|nr:glucokinase [Thermoanaerobaculia bacterium]
MRVLAGDIGGTKTLLRCDDDGAEVATERFESRAYATFDDLLRAFLERVGGEVHAACFAVAGPVVGARARVTNVGWVMEAEALSRGFSIPHVVLINDFTAVALGVPLVGDCVSLQQGARDRQAPVGILGAGTGLGEAILTWHDGTYHVIPSEGGHQDFAPQDEEQTRLFLQLHARYGHVSWERLVSGAGLVNIFTFLGGEERDAAEIAALAGGGDARARRAAEIFVDIYGAEAGNLALRVLARGGIYLAGGIAAKNIDWFTDGRFIEAFRRKGRFRGFCETVPVDVIVDQEVGLKGSLDFARRLVR